MTVYVDDMEAPFGRMKMCHMIADTRDELVEMATRIGVKRKWLQSRDRENEHFDICKAMRAKAVLLGAKEITMRDTVRICRGRRGGAGAMAYYRVGGA